MKIRTLLKSFSVLSVILLAVGCFILVQLISDGDFSLLKSARDYNDVLDNGLKNGDHIKGEIFYSLGSFASKETYTQHEDYRTAGKTSGYYYIIPVGESGLAAIYIREDDVDAMDDLTDETYDYLADGDAPQTGVAFDGFAVKMRKDLDGLESAFKAELEGMGYTDDEIETMLADTDGEYLVLTGPASVASMYVMMIAAPLLIIIAILLIVLKYRKQRVKENKSI